MGTIPMFSYMPFAATIPYTLKRSRRARHIRVAVSCEAVTVTAPHWLAEHHIERFVADKAPWIEKTIAWYKAHTTPLQTAGTAQPSYGACRGRALKLVKEKLAFWNSQYGYSFHHVVIRNQRSRWGSCSKDGNLNFNYRILFLPEPLQDYIVVHELCHLRELNHSRKFWALMKQAIPDFVERKRELRKYRAAG